MKIAMGLLMVLPLLAHHSIRADYDVSKTITLKGTVTAVEWMNPHVRFNLDVVEPDGKVTHWVLETLPPNTLKRLGFGKDWIKQGDQISVDAWVAKDGRKLASAHILAGPDGRTVPEGLGDGWSKQP